MAALAEAGPRVVRCYLNPPARAAAVGRNVSGCTRKRKRVADGLVDLHDEEHLQLPMRPATVSDLAEHARARWRDAPGPPCRWQPREASCSTATQTWGSHRRQPTHERILRSATAAVSRGGCAVGRHHVHGRAPGPVCGIVRLDQERVGGCRGAQLLTRKAEGNEASPWERVAEEGERRVSTRSTS